MRELGDEAGANEQFQEAFRIADETDDYDLSMQVSDLMIDSESEQAQLHEVGDLPTPAEVIRMQPRRKASRAKRRRKR